MIFPIEKKGFIDIYPIFEAVKLIITLFKKKSHKMKRNSPIARRGTTLKQNPDFVIGDIYEHIPSSYHVGRAY